MVDDLLGRSREKDAFSTLNGKQSEKKKKRSELKKPRIAEGGRKEGETK